MNRSKRREFEPNDDNYDFGSDDGQAQYRKNLKEQQGTFLDSTAPPKDKKPLEGPGSDNWEEMKKRLNTKKTA